MIEIGRVTMEPFEKVILTTMCMIYEGDKLLLQNRIKSDWQGFAFCGGHVESEESFVDAIVREVKEETNLDIKHPKLCGIKQFQTHDHIRYIVFLFKTNSFKGELKSSDEGEMVWVKRSELADLNLVDDFFELLEVFDNDTYNELFYEKIKEDKWQGRLV